MCHADPKRTDLYVGAIDVETHAFRRDSGLFEIEFGLPEGVGEIVQAYLFCRYEVEEPCCCDPVKGTHLEKVAQTPIPAGGR